MAKKTLFLDRDGVINRQIIGGYVTSIQEFEFLPGVFEALSILAEQFEYIFVITNQQGIGKNIFSVETLMQIHNFMIQKIQENKGRIDKVYFCPDLEISNSINRKPNPGMGLNAFLDYPNIDLNQAIMVGDSFLDVQFGKNLGIKTAYLTHLKPYDKELANIADGLFVDLLDFAAHQSIL